MIKEAMGLRNKFVSSSETVYFPHGDPVIVIHPGYEFHDSWEELVESVLHKEDALILMRR